MAAIARFKAPQRCYRVQKRLSNHKDGKVQALSLVFLLAASGFQGALGQGTCQADGDCSEGSCCTAAAGGGGGYCGTTCGTQCCSADLSMTCSSDAATCGAGSTGKNDPHFELTGLPDGTDFTWDFHGVGDRTYCMVTDFFLSMNVHMFSMPADVSIIELRAEVDNDFFDGTWMDQMGITYFNEHSEKQSLEIVLNHSAARTSGDPLVIRFLEKDSTTSLFTEGEVKWTSPDKSITATRSSSSSVSIAITRLLTMEIEVEKEAELITEPPIYFLNFEIQTISTTPNVHGFLGQMYAPGAVEERLNMGTLDGFHHREYVEGPDEDYLTSNLTEADCFFNRFGTSPIDGETESEVALGAFSSTSRQSGIPGRRLLKASTARETRRLLEALTGGSQCECVPLCNGSPCSDSCSNAISYAVAPRQFNRIATPAFTGVIGWEFPSLAVGTSTLSIMLANTPFVAGSTLNYDIGGGLLTGYLTMAYLNGNTMLIRVRGALPKSIISTTVYLGYTQIPTDDYKQWTCLQEGTSRCTQSFAVGAYADSVSYTLDLSAQADSGSPLFVAVSMNAVKFSYVRCS